MLDLGREVGVPSLKLVGCVGDVRVLGDRVFILVFRGSYEYLCCIVRFRLAQRVVRVSLAQVGEAGVCDGVAVGCIVELNFILSQNDLLADRLPVKAELRILVFFVTRVLSFETFEFLSPAIENLVGGLGNVLMGEGLLVLVFLLSPVLACAVLTKVLIIFI